MSTDPLLPIEAASAETFLPRGGGRSGARGRASRTARPSRTDRGTTSAPAVACGTSLDLHVVTEYFGELPVAAHLSYLRADPYAVRLHCYVDTPFTVTWLFARHLLWLGLNRPTGMGDVRVRPGHGRDRGWIFLCLDGADGRAVLRARARKVRRFLEQSTRIVPLGTEHQHLDLDAVIERMLSIN